MKPLLEVEAPIVPGHGLAGLEIGRNVVEYGGLLFSAESNFEWWADEDESLRTSWKSVFSLWEARFRLPQVYEWTDAESLRSSMKLLVRSQVSVPDQPARGPDVVEIAVDVRDGLVFALRALGGYEGRLFDVLPTGMSGREAREVEPRLRYDDEGGFVMDGVPGLFLLLAPDGCILTTWPPGIP